MLHRKVEDAVDAADFFGDLRGYGAFLRGTHAFHVGFDATAFADDRNWTGSWGVAKRTHWLARDLTALGLGPRPGPPRPLRVAPSASALLGALYVLVGAAAGARVLLKRTRRLGLDAAAGGLYLSNMASFGDWSAFLDFVEREPIAHEGALIEGAVATFAELREHLTLAAGELA
jgi:heme oxygenase